MFLHRLKNEFAENLKLTLALWIALGVTVWSFFRWWFNPLVEASGIQQTINGLGILAVAVLAFFLTSTLFKRDDLKHPQEFWATRPIRSFTFFGAKLVFAWLAIALPCALLMTLLGLIAGTGVLAVWSGLEVMMWTGLVTNLLALSCMAHPGNRALLGFLCFFGGVIITCILLNNAPLHSLLSSLGVSARQISWNLLVMLIALNLWMGWRCWRLIRDKHTDQRALALGALGALTVLVIAFVPVPGRLPGTALGAPTETVSTVTEVIPGTFGNGYGERYGANFALVQIKLECGESLLGNDWVVSATNLRVVGDNNSLTRAEIETHQQYLNRAGQPMRTNLHLGYYVYDRKPGSSRGSSSGSNPKGDKLIAELPLRKVRVQGTVTMNRIEYRELVRGPLDEPFSHRERGISCRFDPSPDRSVRRGYNATWKTFSPSLVTTGTGRGWETVRLRLENHDIPGFEWTSQLGGGSRGGGDFLGSYRMQELRVSDAEIESDFHWSQLKEKGFGKSVQEWKRDARLVFEVMERVTPVIVPVDVEIEVPDPDKLRELLRKDALR